MEENIVYKLINTKHEYKEIIPDNFKDGHGGSLSVKVVVPSYCQANCSFCFNKLTKNTQKHDYEIFLDNLVKSLDMIVNNVTNRGITLDITGNEPTFDIFLFKELMNLIKEYKKYIDKIVLTTNGYKLDKCINDMIKVIDIVNISVHHYDYLVRKKIFNTDNIPNDDCLKEIVSKLKNNNIKVTAVSVLDKEINFYEYYNKFTKWAKDIGFDDIRIRSNFCKNDKFIDDIINYKMNNEKISILDALTIKEINDLENNIKVYILKGVPDLTEYVIGTELVIDDDGLCYIDYNKRYMVDKNNIGYFNKMYVYNDKKLVKKK